MHVLSFIDEFLPWKAIFYDIYGEAVLLKFLYGPVIIPQQIWTLPIILQDISHNNTEK